MVRLVNATSIHPKVLQVILSSSFSAEADLVIASLVLAGAGHQLVICDFLTIDPSMGEDSIRGNVVVLLASQKAHSDRCPFTELSEGNRWFSRHVSQTGGQEAQSMVLRGIASSKRSSLDRPRACAM